MVHTCQVLLAVGAFASEPSHPLLSLAFPCRSCHLHSPGVCASVSGGSYSRRSPLSTGHPQGRGALSGTKNSPAHFESLGIGPKRGHFSVAPGRPSGGFLLGVKGWDTAGARLARKNTGCPAQCEIQKDSSSFFSISVSQILHGTCDSIDSIWRC